MAHESLDSQSTYQRVIASNVEAVQSFLNDNKNRFTTLAFIDPDSGEVSGSSSISKCDELNRQMLDSVYAQLGVNEDAPNATRETRYSDGRIVEERIFILSERKAQVAEMFTSYKNTEHTGFIVMVSGAVSI